MFPTEYSSLSQLSNEYSIPKSMYCKQVGVTQTMKDDVTTKVCLFTNILDQLLSSFRLFQNCKLVWMHYKRDLPSPVFKVGYPGDGENICPLFGDATSDFHFYTVTFASRAPYPPPPLQSTFSHKNHVYYLYSGTQLPTNLGLSGKFQGNYTTALWKYFCDINQALCLHICKTRGNILMENISIHFKTWWIAGSYKVLSMVHKIYFGYFVHLASPSTKYLKKFPSNM